MFDYFRSAFHSIRTNKIRSLLTVLGVVIGVSAVITLTSVGQGLKNDASDIIRGLGSNLIAVIGGRIDPENLQNGQVNPSQFLATDILTMDDVQTVTNTPGVQNAMPMSLVNTIITNKDKSATPMILGIYSNFDQIITLMKIGQGRTFNDRDDIHSIILAKNTKEILFGSSPAIGQQILLGKTEFSVIGVFQTASGSALGGEYDNLSIIPFEAATELNKGQIKIFRIVAKVDNNYDPKEIKKTIKSAILKNHNNQEDFSVLTQDDLLGVVNKFLELATTLVSAIAAISLIVGGIGIMNIMLVVVTERTREIGLRKAIGASSIAILFQFLIESIIITLLGGIIGLGIAMSANALIAAKTSLTPDITPDIIIIALGISTIIGIIFGLWPALRAAKKDPIEALRYE